MTALETVYIKAIFHGVSFSFPLKHGKSNMLLMPYAKNMNYRKFSWDYRRRASYMITLSLHHRSKDWLGTLDRFLTTNMEQELVEKWDIALTPWGKLIEQSWLDIARHWPGVEIKDYIIMPEHLHGILKVTKDQKFPLGNIIASFKAKTTAATRRLFPDLPYPALKTSSIWNHGFQDSILWNEARLQNARRYILENPRRLGEKRTHPELFQICRKVEIPLMLSQEILIGKFVGVGNLHLLEHPDFHQIQCSRSAFRYQTDCHGALLPEQPPALCTNEFLDMSRQALAKASTGMVLVAPCISHGEKEIARRVLSSGGKAILLQSQGFPPLYKPSGKLFEYCVNGQVLLLSPYAWQHQRNSSKITRDTACVLNRIAQLIVNNGPSPIHYAGYTPANIDAMVKQAICSGP